MFFVSLFRMSVDIRCGAEEVELARSVSATVELMLFLKLFESTSLFLQRVIVVLKGINIMWFI